jgi:D-alanine-D-alanine ligase
LAEVCADPERYALTVVVHIGRDGGARIFHDAPWPVDEADLLARQAVPTIDAVRYLADCGAFVFSLLHGTEGEDGCWQGVAEVLGLRGSFGPVIGSALGMDKSRRRGRPDPRSTKPAPPAGRAPGWPAELGTKIVCPFPR